MAKTIMFVHGAWVTPACWDRFVTFFENKGYTCVAPAWPYLDKPVNALKQGVDSRFSQLSIETLVQHYRQKILAMPELPILVGHSFGGLIVQLLLDRGLGTKGAALDPAPPRGVAPSWTAVQSSMPVLLSWQGWAKIHNMSLQSFSKTFANALPASEMQLTYEQYIVPAPGRIFFQAALGLGNEIHFANPNRVPLLLVAGLADKTASPDMVRATYAKYKKFSNAVEITEFPERSHWLLAEPGWEEVASKILAWIEK